MSDDLDELLKRALSKSDPPPDFSGRVLARLNRERAPKKLWITWTAAAAGILMAASTYIGMSQRRTAEQNKAGQELVFAIQVASEKIAAVDARLKRSSPQLQLDEKNFRQER